MLGSRVLLIVGLVAAGQMVAPVALAHIELLEPAARYGRNDIKSCPCGRGGSDRTCNVAADGSDPARSQNVTPLVAGSTITVRFNEFIPHGGRMRIAIDRDGADFADFNQEILLDVPDPANQSGMWELDVTLPDVECDNCTLQLIQVMEVDTQTPVIDPSNMSTYYTCADIVLTAGEGTSATTGETDTTDGMDTTGTTDTGTTGPDTGGTTGTTTGDIPPTTGTTGTTDGGDTTTSTTSTSTTNAGGESSSSGGSSSEGDDESKADETAGSSESEGSGPGSTEDPNTGLGCACDASGSPSGGGPLAMLGMVLGLAWTRRRTAAVRS